MSIPVPTPVSWSIAAGAASLAVTVLLNAFGAAHLALVAMLLLAGGAALIAPLMRELVADLALDGYGHRPPPARFAHEVWKG